ncbi:helix-turn-helix transcriptional regulator [Microbacterium indicum]|uniref:helix-turn-helix transcriptional regulator n=1 Tax=Microbacterium indicum TaxID=358100 RepID=UPI00041F42AA|nr:hypothetical protein [Microbacterium indicum]
MTATAATYPTTELKQLDTAALPPFITITVACDLTGLSRWAVRNAIAAGEIRARRMGPRALRIETTSLLAWGTPITSAASL